MPNPTQTTRRGADTQLPTLPYELDACNQMPLPDGLGYADQQTYLSLRLLYQSYKQHMLSADDARKEKAKILEAHKHLKFREKSGSLWSTIICKTDVARMNYRKNRTLENADALIEAIEGLPIPAHNTEEE